jgi:uncharacterized membrane protein
MKIFRNVIVILMVIITILWGLSFLLSSKYTVERSIIIAAPVDSVFSYVSDLKKWRYWSPWLSRVSDASIKYSFYTSGNKSSMKWKSLQSGDGEVSILTTVPNQSITYSLKVEGFETHQRGEFLFDNLNGSTRVKWIDKGDLGPSPMSKYYIVVIENMIGSDFNRGLHDLKMTVEK